MIAEQLDSETFRMLLGDPTEVERAWGHERHYHIDQKKLGTYQQQLKATVYHHHSSFDYAIELKELGFPQTAQAMQEERSGLPSLHETQMGNLGEVLGTEYGRWLLGFETTLVLPKRFNPNLEQSMKGVDILGTTSSDERPALLLGEAKCHKKLALRRDIVPMSLVLSSQREKGKGEPEKKPDPIQSSYTHLVSLHQHNAAKLLLFAKEILRVQGNTKDLANLERVCDLSSIVERSTLMFIVTQHDHPDLFKSLDALFGNSPLPNLLAVHVCIENLENWLPKIFGVSEA